MENLDRDLDRDNVKNIENEDVKVEKKIAFSGKVLPSTSAEFEELFEGMTSTDGGKLKFEDKLLMLIDAAREKFADDKLKLEEDTKKSLEFDLKAEKSELEGLVSDMNVLINTFESKAKKQLASFKNKISSEVSVRAQLEKQNTIALLEEFRLDHVMIHAKNKKLIDTINEKEEEIGTLNEQVRDAYIELSKTSDKLKLVENENSKINSKIVILEKEHTAIKDKYTVQLDKNEELRDKKEMLEKELSGIDAKHQEEITKLMGIIEELKANNSTLEASETRLEEALKVAKEECVTIHQELDNSKKQISEKDIQLNELKTDVKVSQKEVEMLKANLDEVKESKSKLESENKELNNSLKELEVDHNRLIDNNKEVHKRMTRLIDENKTLKNSLNQSKEELHKLKSEK